MTEKSEGQQFETGLEKQKESRPEKLLEKPAELPVENRKKTEEKVEDKKQQQELHPITEQKKEIVQVSQPLIKEAKIEAFRLDQAQIITEIGKLILF